MTEDGDNGIDVAKFFDANSSLFIVLGVFSALAIYISELGGGSLDQAPIEIRIGFGGSLLLTLLSVLLIYRQMANYVGSFEELLKAHTSFQNWDLIIFTAGAAFLLPALITPILQQLLTLYYLIGVLLLLFSVPLYARIVLGIDQKLADEGLIRDIPILALSLVVLWATRQYSEYLRANPEKFEPSTFSTENLNPLIYDIMGVQAEILSFIAAVLISMSGVKIVEEIGDRVREIVK